MSNHDPAPSSGPTKTYPHEVPSIPKERRLRTVRRVGLLALTAFVLLGLTGLLGIKSSTNTASSGPLEVSLRHASVARPGLAVPYHLTISREGGFSSEVEVRIPTGYLESLDENGVNPAADSATSNRTETIFTFDPPDSDVFTFWLDMRVEPSEVGRNEGSTTVVVGTDTVVVDHPMWILP